MWSFESTQILVAGLGVSLPPTRAELVPWAGAKAVNIQKLINCHKPIVMLKPKIDQLFIQVKLNMFD